MRGIQAQKRLAMYWIALSSTGMALVYLVTHRFGPGISTDGSRYLSTAQSLVEGRGFYDYLDIPLTQFPPLYSLLIAGISLLGGLDVFVAAQILNILSFGLVIWLAGVFFYRIFPEEPLFSWVGSAVFATSLSLLIMASNILSDLLFLAFTLAFLTAATEMLETGTRRSILFLGAIAGVSAFQRYAGLTLILTGSLLLLFLYRKHLLKAFVYAGLFGALSALPILFWVVFHNYSKTGILFGLRLPPNYSGNLQVTIEKAAHWFLPATLTNILPLWAMVLIGAFLLVTGNRSSNWRRWLNALTSSFFLPSVVFFVLYVCVLVFNISYSEVRWPYMDRIHIIILPALLALLFLTIRELTPLYIRKLSLRKLQVLSLVVFLVWLSFPVYNLQKYLKNAYIQGETSEYNMYNIPVLRESRLGEYLTAQAVDSNEKIYSNYEAAAWFLTRLSITKLPHGEVGEKRVNAEDILKEFPTWPGKDGNGYLVWIKALSFKPYVLTPAQLVERVDLQLLYTSKGGDIYLLTPR